MRLPKITIITPTLNTGQQIETSLKSVAAQTYHNIEHIIVDGASTDSTLDIIRSFQKAHKNVRLLSESDSGIYFAMNKGLNLCTGDWIYFMGADDSFYNENVLTELYNLGFFKEEQIVYGNVILQGDAPWAKNNSVYDGLFTLDKLFRSNICHQSIFYPKSVISRIGYYETKYKITSDWDFNVRCWAKYKFTFTDKVIAYFKTGGKSSEGGDYSLHLDFPINVVKYFNLDIHDPDLSLATSQFYYPMARLRETEYEKTINNLNKEKEQLQSAISEIQQRNNESISELKDHNRRMVDEIKKDHEKVLSTVVQEYTDLIKVIKNEYSVLINDIKRDQSEAFHSLKTNHQNAMNQINEEYQSIISLQKIEQNNFLETQKTEFMSFLHILKNEYDTKTVNLQNEIRALQNQNNLMENEYNDQINRLGHKLGQLSDSVQLKENEIQELKYSHSLEIDNFHTIINNNDIYIHNIFNSYTWKTGKILLAPIIFLKRIFFKD